MLELLHTYPRVVDVALALSTGILIAATSSWITVQLSLRRFRTERWWERKVEAYERIIAALHDAKAFADAYFERQGRIADDDAEELRMRSKIGSEEIAKAMDIGSFLLPDEALARLRQYTTERGKASEQDNWTQYMGALWDATDDCLKDLIQIAKCDLKAK